jgi:hypothetical protein
LRIGDATIARSDRTPTADPETPTHTIVSRNINSHQGRYSEDIQGGESVMRHKVIWITAATVIMMPLYVLAFTRGTGITFSEPTVYTPPSNGSSSSEYVVFGQFNMALSDIAQDQSEDMVRVIRVDYETTDFQLLAYDGLGTGQWAASGTTAFTVELPSADFSCGVDKIFAADVNGDWWLDVIVLFRFEDWDWESPQETQFQYMTFLNTGGTGFRCAGDVDGDGQTRVEDLVGLLEDWGCDDSAQ